MPLTLTSVVSGFNISPLSGVYTNITPVQFSAIYSGAIMSFHAVWLFGDGNYHASTDTIVTHRYNKPGLYSVTLIAFNTIEEFKNYLLQNNFSLSALPISPEYVTFTNPLTVTNYIYDSIDLTNVAAVFQSRKQSVPFRVTFKSSYNEIPIFQVYSENSLSQPWHTIDPKWSHLKPQWKFIDIYGNNIDTLVPVASSVNTLIVNGSSPLSAVPFDSTIPSTIVVGTSGYADFYYVDDMPGIVYLHITPNMQIHNNPYDKEYVTIIPSYANSNLTITHAYLIISSTPTHLVITSNGIPSFTLQGTKWLKSLTPYVISICDAAGYVLHNLPLNNTFGSLYPINRSLVNINNNGVIFELPIATFQRYDSDGFDTGGYYVGFFQSLSSSNNTQLSATVTMQTSAGLVHISGVSDPFSILSYDTNFSIRKFNENFDMAATIKSYVLQETIANNPVLFDSLIGQIVGDNTSLPENLGKSIYEKISNYVDNHSNIDLCNIDKLYSLCQELGISIEDFNLNFPNNIKRIMNILSISYSRLKGGRELFDRNLLKDMIITSAPNLGTQLNTLTYMVTAGVNIVINERHTNAYEIFHTVPLNGFNTYSLLQLSAFNFKTPLDTYYKFFTYVPGFTLTQLEGVINWGDPYTTLTEGISSIDVWLNDAGIVETIFDYQLRKGLELISN